ncbi:MAG: tail fiber domain-containing protein, partial [Bacteroidota bacterium]
PSILYIQGEGGSTILSGDGGNVGIGTNTPTKAKVEIAGSGSSYTVSGQSRFYGSGGYNSNTNFAGNFSIYADGYIAGGAFIAHSDARIKEIKGISNDQTDLKTLMKIEVTDYKMRDSLAKGNRPIKKVIAQQVADVYPQAVTNNLTEVIPDIYQRAEVHDGWIILSTDLQAGERIKLITETTNEIYEVLETEPSRFKVGFPSTVSGHTSSVFVYGREVKDFHTVDYEAISILNVSATQAQQARIETLEGINDQLMQKNAVFEARLQALEAQLLN